MAASDLEHLIQLLARLPSLGPRSARRAALHLLKRRDALMTPLSRALAAAAESVRTCSACGNLDGADPCSICSDPRRDPSSICVVEEVDDLWALERAGAHRGLYHVLGGTLSALEGIGPEDLRIDGLLRRVEAGGDGNGGGGPRVKEVILAVSATVDGQTTAHYLSERLAGSGAEVTRPAHGLPVGGELNYLDDGTLGAAFRARRPVA